MNTGAARANIHSPSTVWSLHEGLVSGYDRKAIRERSRLNRRSKMVSGSHQAKYLSQGLTLGPSRNELERIFAKDRETAIARAYREHGYRLQEISAHLEIHYATVSRKLKKIERRT